MNFVEIMEKSKSTSVERMTRKAWAMDVHTTKDNEFGWCKRKLSSLPRFQQFHSGVTKFCFETVSGKHALRQSNKQQRQSLETD